jgi:hypothetical protein
MCRVEPSIAIGWTMEEAVFDLRTIQETFLLSTEPIEALVITNSPHKCVLVSPSTGLTAEG